MKMAQKMKVKKRQNKKLALQILIGVATTIIITVLLSFLSARFGGFASTNIAAQSLSDRMTWPVIIHLASVIPAVFIGAFVLWRKKGDKLHKNLGKLWAALMLITAFATIWIGAPGAGIAGSGFSFIHIFTVITFISVPYAIWEIRRGNVEGHRQAMRGLYIGALIAGGFAFLPGRIMNILAFG